MKCLVLVTWTLVAIIISNFDLVNLAAILDQPINETLTRITKGQTAYQGQFPYQVGLTAGGDSFCGGALIGDTWVVTAAHCVDGASYITIYFGSIERTNPKYSITVLWGAIRLHPNWNRSNLKNDIALINTPSVILTSTIGIIRLPSISFAYSTYVGSTGTVAGWGKTSDSSGVANTLQYARMPIVANSVCSNTYGSLVTASNMCASTTGGISTCSGDSGGPLVVESSKLLVGITSFGHSAGCTKGHPVSFTRITTYLEWIKSTAGIAY